jgi:hypothetical protein
MMKRKGQLDHPIIAFFFLVVGLIILAPIVMKMFVSIQTPLSSSLGNLTDGGLQAQANVNHILNVATLFWDKVIIFAFVSGILLLFVSAYFIDVNPIFIIFYIIINFVFILFAPDIIESIGSVYDPTSSAYYGADVINNLTFTSWIVNNFGIFIVGLMVITGIIIYTKIAWGGSSSRQ